MSDHRLHRTVAPGLRRQVLAALFLITALPGQGTGSYLNFESPQVKPITVARVGGRDWLLVTNTPDASLEVYDVRTHALVQRLRTGQEPVSVTFAPALGRAYVANLLGDSVTAVRATALPQGVRFEVERTVTVGDEPMLALVGPDTRLWVVLASSATLVTLDPLTLQPAADLPRPVALRCDGLGMREPRTLQFQGDTQWVLATLGGGSPGATTDWDFDLCVRPRHGTPRRIAGLGTANTGLAVMRDGTVLVTGVRAQNQVVGEAQLRDLPTGFVQSWLWRITANADGFRSVGRDLNAAAPGRSVPPGQSLAHPMDVVAYEPHGAPARVFVAAMHNDRIGVVDVTSDDAWQWTVAGIDVPPLPGRAMAGPRGLALRYRIDGDPQDPGDRLYVLNRVDHSVAVIDPGRAVVVDRFPLANDPSSPAILRGRRFLYDARLSHHHHVACASCHLDGRSDGLAWRLGDGTGSYDVRFPPKPDGLCGIDAAVFADCHHGRFPVDKGAMVTQSLQGLMNWEVNNDCNVLFHNSPLHWRGDIAYFPNFNPVFVSLFGLPNLSPPGAEPAGIPRADMDRFRDFVNTISYPPNPLQRPDRVYSGWLGAPDDDGQGAGAQLGLKLFHVRRLTAPAGARDAAGGRSCVHCHALPEGSNNRATQVADGQPLETAALRSVARKEARRLLEDGALVPCGETGLTHDGGMGRLEDLLARHHGHAFNPLEAAAVVQYLRELDVGVAPLVGQSVTITRAQRASAEVTRFLDLAEAQTRRANVGLAIQARIGGVDRGFWFDLTGDTEGYREEPECGTPHSRAALLDLLATADDLLVAQATPLGSDRRIAAPSGVVAPLPGPPPSAVRLVPMQPDSAHGDVPRLRRNWPVGTDPVHDFVWHGVLHDGDGTRPAPEPGFARNIRLLQEALLHWPEFGLTSVHHEAPRRFRVAGRDLRHGAALLLFMPNSAKEPPPYVSTEGTMYIRLPVYPTAEHTADGLRIWESAVEAEPTLVYMLMIGGTGAKGAYDAYNALLPEPPPAGAFDPPRWNRHLVCLLNDDGTVMDAGWQPVRIADPPPMPAPPPTAEPASTGDSSVTAAWQAAAAAVTSDPRTQELRLRPQPGLLPLGTDPESGLQEFAHLGSGAVPSRGADGRLVVGAATGMVLVLVPGTADMGRAPFFLARAPVTQAQWLRLTTPASAVPPGAARDARTCVDWFDSEQVLARHGLELPTAAQWEQGDAVLAPPRSRAGAASAVAAHAPDALWEWTRDGLPDAGMRPAGDGELRVVRCSCRCAACRAAAPGPGWRPQTTRRDLGLRAARAVTP